MRYTQQDDVYRAERAIPLGRTFDSIDDVQQYVDALRDKSWWADGYPQVMRIEVALLHAGSKWAGLGHFERENSAGLVQLKPDALDARTLCHELAHVFATAAHSSASHDPWYCRIYLTMVSHIMGPDAFVALLDAFNAHNVNHDPARQRQGEGPC